MATIKSIEEKAKHYDEAYKKVAIRFGSNVADEIFPELVEGENEKIRKRIIHALHGDVLEMSEIKEAVAWLEKQGNNMGISEATKQKLEDNLYKALEKETPESCNEFLEKQVEQKSIDDLTPQEAMDIAVAKCFEQGEQKPVFEMKTPEESLGIDSDTYNKIVDECIYGEQNTAWSEEDINMIDWLIRCCEKEHEELCNDRYGHQEIVSDLKRDCRKKWDWLESLKNRVAHQKQWKPSDEQMNALNYVVNLMASSERPTENDLYYNILKSLRQQLKKLK